MIELSQPERKNIMKRNIILSILLITVTAVLAVYMDRTSFKVQLQFSENMSLKQLAKKNNIPVNELLHVLSHENRAVWDLPRNVPVKELGLAIDRIKHVLEHVGEDKSTPLHTVKYILWSIWLSGVLVFVLTRKKITKVRTVLMILAVIVFGVLLGSSPNPMESLVKLAKIFKRMTAEPEVVVVSFVLFSLFSIVGNKLFCGWGCQLGALQETIFNIPVFKRKYRLQVPFVLSLLIRLILFITFLCLLFGLVPGWKNFVLYHHVNYFKIYNFHDLAAVALYSLPILLLASFFIFRPFCQFVCPFGFYAWLLENITVNRISIDPDKCTDCCWCVKSCSTKAMEWIYERKRKFFLPDCWSCGKCIEACPENAIRYENILIRKKGK